MRRERRRAIDVRQIGGVMIGAGMYRALWRWIEPAGGGGDLLLVMVWVGDSQKNIEWQKLVVCQERVILRYFTYDGQKYRIKISRPPRPPSLDRTSLIFRSAFSGRS
jgi:hypothetical protein